MKRHRKLKAGAKKRRAEESYHGWWGCKARSVHHINAFWPQHFLAVCQVAKKLINTPLLSGTV